MQSRALNGPRVVNVNKLMNLSERKVAANRQNAKKSTGPRTIAGKRRASRNALRHGLTIPVAYDPELEEEGRAFVSKLVQAYGPEERELREAARFLANANAAIRRVRCARLELLNSIEIGHPLDVASCESEELKMLDKIIQLERYEQRSRRRRERALTQWLLALEAKGSSGQERLVT